MRSLEVEVDLRNQFGPVRDQGARPTCLAFAASDTHAGLRAGWDPLSCEFAFYHAQRRAGRSPVQGAVLPAMLETLKRDGQPLELGWPYLEVVPSGSTEWTPPEAIGLCYARDGMAGVSDLKGVRSALTVTRPVVMLTMLSQSFFMPVAGVVDPEAGEQPQPSLRHAVVAVGYGKIDGDGAILVRNSWGASWGTEGHAWLTDRFLESRLFATATLLEEVNVSSGPIAA
jgi:hypothetical protein